MGAFDEAEVCEAASHFHLYQLSKNYNKKDIYTVTIDYQYLKTLMAPKLKKTFKTYTKII